MLHRMNSIKEGQDCELVNFIKICLVESSLGMSVVDLMIVI